MNLTLIFFILAVIQFVLDKIIAKNDERVSHTDGVIQYRWFIIIGVVVVISFFLFVQGPNRYVGSGVLIILIFGIRSLFEWRYIRSSQRHIMSLSMMAISLIGTIAYVLFNI